MTEKQIGLRVNKLREQQGLTTTDLAKRVGISQAQISRLENGKQGFRSATLVRIAKALGVKPVHFWTEEEGEAAYGATGELGEALQRPEFRDIVERAARAYLKSPTVLSEMARALESTAGSRSPLA